MATCSRSVKHRAAQMLAHVGLDAFERSQCDPASLEFGRDTIDHATVDVEFLELPFHELPEMPTRGVANLENPDTIQERCG